MFYESNCFSIFIVHWMFVCFYASVRRPEETVHRLQLQERSSVPTWLETVNMQQWKKFFDWELFVLCSCSLFVWLFCDLLSMFFSWHICATELIAFLLVNLPHVAGFYVLTSYFFSSTDYLWRAPVLDSLGTLERHLRTRSEVDVLLQNIVSNRCSSSSINNLSIYEFNALKCIFAAIWCWALGHFQVSIELWCAVGVVFVEFAD